MKNWSFYGNSYLRYLDSARKQKNSLIICTQSVQELQSALEAIKEYAMLMNYGKAKIETQAGTISIFIGNSKEIS